MKKNILILNTQINDFIDTAFLSQYHNVDYDNSLSMKGFDNDFLIHIFRKVNSKKYDFVFLGNITNLSDNEFKKLKIFKNKFPNTIFICVDVLYPSVSKDKNFEIEFRKHFLVISDFAVNEFQNSIEVPILSILNMDIITQTHLYGYPDLKTSEFKMYDEFDNKNYDVMFKLGKPKISRLIVSALMIKHKLKNHYTNISFSKEPVASQFNFDINIFWDSILNDIDLDKIELNDYIKKIPIQTYLNSEYGTKRFKKTSCSMGYTFDLNSYAEIYMESETCQLDVINNYKNLVQFTEKTFNNFFFFKIPLAIDSEKNIEYLKNLGFKFPIEPCYIKVGDDLTSFYLKVDKWIENLKKYNFKEMWNNMYYSARLDSALHNNHLLCKEFLSKTSIFDNNVSSKPQYLATYKFIERCMKEDLNNYINWDFQTFTFLKNKNLIQ